MDVDTLEWIAPRGASAPCDNQSDIVKCIYLHLSIISRQPDRGGPVRRHPLVSVSRRSGDDNQCGVLQAGGGSGGHLVHAQTGGGRLCSQEGGYGNK